MSKIQKIELITDINDEWRGLQVFYNDFSFDIWQVYDASKEKVWDLENELMSSGEAFRLPRYKDFSLKNFNESSSMIIQNETRVKRVACTFFCEKAMATITAREKLKDLLVTAKKCGFPMHTGKLTYTYMDKMWELWKHW